VGKSSAIAARVFSTPIGRMLVATALQNRTADMLLYIQKKTQETIDKVAKTKGVTDYLPVFNRYQ